MDELKAKLAAKANKAEQVGAPAGSDPAPNSAEPCDAYKRERQPRTRTVGITVGPHILRRPPTLDPPLTSRSVLLRGPQSTWLARTLATAGVATRRRRTEGSH